jgi:hypothetical protein
MNKNSIFNQLQSNICYVNVTILFFTTDLTQDNQIFYEMYPTHLPICVVAMAIKDMCKYCRKIFGSDFNLHSLSFLSLE